MSRCVPRCACCAVLYAVVRWAAGAAVCMWGTVCAALGGGGGGSRVSVGCFSAPGDVLFLAGCLPPLSRRRPPPAKPLQSPLPSGGGAPPLRPSTASLLPRSFTPPPTHATPAPRMHPPPPPAPPLTPRSPPPHPCRAPAAATLTLLQIPDSQKDVGSNHAVSALKFRIIQNFMKLGYAVFLSGGCGWVGEGGAGGVMHCGAGVSGRVCDVLCVCYSHARPPAPPPRPPAPSALPALPPACPRTAQTWTSFSCRTRLTIWCATLMWRA